MPGCYDITKRVYGKFNDGEMNLFVHNEQIGRLVQTADGLAYEMNKGYVMKHNRIFRYEEAQEPVTQYVSDCDLGWC